MCTDAPLERGKALRALKAVYREQHRGGTDYRHAVSRERTGQKRVVDRRDLRVTRTRHAESSVRPYRRRAEQESNVYHRHPRFGLQESQERRARGQTAKPPHELEISDSTQTRQLDWATSTVPAAKSSNPRARAVAKTRPLEYIG